MISAIICTHNRYDVLPDAISSIERQTLSKDLYELIVVDNSTPGDTKETFLTKLAISCNAKYVIEDRPGLSNARNIGVQHSDANFVVFLDDDAIAQADWLQAALDRFLSDESIAVVGGPVEPIWPAERPKWLHEWQEGFLTILDRGQQARDLDANEWLAGTNIGFRKENLLQAGGFNSSIGRVGKLLLSNEELAVTHKIVELGKRAFYEPKMKLRHKVHLDRLNQSWFRRRAGWQAVSDMMSSSSVQSDVDGDIRKINEFIGSLPIRKRNLESLFLEAASREEFQKQLAAIEALTRIILLSESPWKQ